MASGQTIPRAGTRQLWWRGHVAWTMLPLLAGIAMRLWFVGHAPVVAGDGLLYADIAHNWFWHGVYGITRGQGIHPTLIRLPGYPFFLGLCFFLFGVGNFHAVMLVQVGFDLATCGLIAGSAARLFGERAGRVALWLALLCPFTANYVATALTETLSIFCVALVLYVLARWGEGAAEVDRWVWAVGAGLAGAILLRPEQGLLAAAVIPAMVWRVWRLGSSWRRLGPVVVAALVAVAPLGPWAGRNWRTFHVIQPLAPRNANDPGEWVPVGFQRWFRTWGVDFISTDQVYWNYDNDDMLPGNLPARAFDSGAQRSQTFDLLERYNLTTSASSGFDAEFSALAAARIQGHRLRYDVALPLARLGNMLFRPRTELLAVPLDWWRWRQHRGASGLAVLFLGLNAGYFALAGLGLWRRRCTWNWLSGGMMLFCILRCVMLATIDNSEPRYTLELFPVLIPWAAAFFGASSGGRSSGSSQA